MNSSNEKALSVKDVALLLNVTERTIYRLAQKNGLPGFKVAGTWRFMRRDLQVWVEEQKLSRASYGQSVNHCKGI